MTAFRFLNALLRIHFLTTLPGGFLGLLIFVYSQCRIFISKYFRHEINFCAKLFLKSVKPKMQKLFKQMSNKPSTLIELDSTSTSSSSSSSSAVSAVMDAIEIAGSDSDSDSTQEINFDEKIRGKEKAIREVDLYITKLQDRRKQLFDECNKLKDQKALRQSNELAKQNWDSGEYR